jgi:putative membrane protein
MSAPELTTQASRRRWPLRIAVAAVVVVPLAFAGLFVGALSNSDTAIDRVPAALVNEDELIYQTAPDGTETPVFAGRQLVTELVADKSFDWTITNVDDAEQALADGEVHAILTIPADFSASILSLSTDEPERATLSIHTDDGHSYLSGAVSESVGSGMADAFGTAITAQYITGITSGMGELGVALADAADGAGQLSDGVVELGSGLSELASGAASAGSGATDFSGGVAGYTGGVDQLAGGLGSLSAGASGLSRLSAGVTTYTAGVSHLAAQIAAVNADLAADPTDPVALATLDYLSTELSKAAAGGAQLAPQVSGGIAGIQGGISKSASAAAQISGGSAALRSGASSLASGVNGLASGAESAAAGANELATGAGELAAGLESGAEQVPVMGEDEQRASAGLAADPVGVDVTRANEVMKPTQALAAFLVPLGLWIGALSIFLIERRIPTRMLVSTARSARLVSSALGRASLIALAQAGVLVALLHLGLGVSWSVLPATLAFSVLMALAFTTFHYWLTSALGRAGLVVSLFAIAIQVTSTGGLYPIELLAAPFQLISPLLPLTYAVDGMQSIIAGGSGASVLAAACALVAFGVVSALLALVSVSKSRRVSAVAFATA